MESGPWQARPQWYLTPDSTATTRRLPLPPFACKSRRNLDGPCWGLNGGPGLFEVRREAQKVLPPPVSPLSTVSFKAFLLCVTQCGEVAEA